MEEQAVNQDPALADSDRDAAPDLIGGEREAGAERFIACVEQFVDAGNTVREAIRECLQLGGLEEEGPRGRAAAPARGSDLSVEDMMLLRKHVINLNQGLLSGGGLFDNTPGDVDAIFDAHLPNYLNERRRHLQDGQQDGPVRIVFYAHGGLVSERSALLSALKHIEWWNRNGRRTEANRGVYPIFFVWETGFLETIGQLLSGVGARAAARAARDVFDFTTDPMVELAARHLGGVLLWGGMKGSALTASSPQGGAHYAAQGLQRLVAQHGNDLELHAVGHSAGSIFHSHFLPVATDLGGKVFKRAYFMAPAARVDIFQKTLRPRIGAGAAKPAVEELVMFTMAKDAERADDCAGVYRKSLLYLIHHALEKEGRTPVLGLEESIRSDDDLRSLFGLTGGAAPGKVVWSPTSATVGRSATRSRTHGGFDDDVPTMNSILRRVCGLSDQDPIDSYPPSMSRAVDGGSEQREVPEEIAFLFDDGAPSVFGVGAPFSRGSAPRGSGRRRALCVGINRYERAPLSGCVADAQDWKRTLEGLGFEAPLLLLDGEATRSNMMDRLDRLIQTSGPSDLVVFQYAGHGTQAPDRSGDEANGDSPEQDEAICPVDFHLGHLLVDDDLGEIFARTPDGVCVTCFIDCCHSGTITRFAAGEPPGPRAGEKARFLTLTPQEKSKHLQFRRTQGGTRAARRRRSLDEMREVVFSACLSVEVALESEGHGHFTQRAVRMLRNGTEVTNEEFQRRVTEAFGSTPRQHPNLDCAPRARTLPLFSAGGEPRPAPISEPDKSAGSEGAARESKALARALRAAAAALEREAP